jgi:hypothetical protein
MCISAGNHNAPGFRPALGTSLAIFETTLAFGFLWWPFGGFGVTQLRAVTIRIVRSQIVYAKGRQTDRLFRTERSFRDAEWRCRSISSGSGPA